LQEIPADAIATVRGPDGVERRYAPIHLAAMLGDANGIILLAHWGNGNVNLPDGRGYTPLMLAAIMGHEDAVKTLVRAGAECKIPVAEVTPKMREIIAKESELMKCEREIKYFRELRRKEQSKIYRCRRIGNGSL